MATRETIAFEFRRKTREPQMREIRDIVGDYGGVMEEGVQGRTVEFINPQGSISDTQARSLVAYMGECGFELVKARMIQESRVENDLDIRLLS